jgi:hypothetical protein
VTRSPPARESASELCTGNRGRYGQRLVDRQLMLPFQTMPQRFPFDVRHDVVQQPVRAPRVEQRQQVGMLEIGGNPDLAQEPLGPEHRAELRIEHLEGDRSLVPNVSREKHGCHAAATDLALDLVSVLKIGSEVGQEIHARSYDCKPP